MQETRAMEFFALAFLRSSGAQGLGHVGWAFRAENGAFNVGAVENPSGLPFALPGHTGFWTDWVADPVAAFRLASSFGTYDHYKLIPVDVAHPREAWETVRWVEAQPYLLSGRNCSDSAYDVLQAYGVRDMAPPKQAWNPNMWFLGLPGQIFRIDTPLTFPENHEARRLVFELLQLSDLSADVRSALAPFLFTRAIPNSLYDAIQALASLANAGEWVEFEARLDHLRRIFK
jgi:hypothetical protein